MGAGGASCADLSGTQEGPRSCENAPGLRVLTYDPAGPGWRNWSDAAGLNPAAREGMGVRVPPRAWQKLGRASLLPGVGGPVSGTGPPPCESWQGEALPTLADRIDDVDSATA